MTVSLCVGISSAQDLARGQVSREIRKRLFCRIPTGFYEAAVNKVKNRCQGGTYSNRVLNVLSEVWLEAQMIIVAKLTLVGLDLTRPILSWADSEFAR